MFYERLVSLCASRNTNPTALCNAIGLAQSAATRWRNGSVPRDTTLKKIADHFGVSVSYLLGATDDPSEILSAQVFSNLAASMQQVVEELDKKKKPVLGLNPKLSALIDSMNKDELDDLERYAEFILSKKKSN